VRRVTPSSRFCNYSTAAITTNEEEESGWRNRRYFASRSVILPTPVQLQITIMWNGESSRLSKFVHRDFSSFLSSSVQFHFYDFFFRFNRVCLTEHIIDYFVTQKLENVWGYIRPKLDVINVEFLNELKTAT
jgi:hypothetical protein